MPRHNFVKTTLLLTTFISLSIPLSSVLIDELEFSSSYAVSAETGKQNQENFWVRLFVKKTSRGSSRTPFCSIWPNPDDQDLREIWNDRPLFIWKNTGEFEIAQIEVRVKSDDSKTAKKPYKVEDFNQVIGREHNLIYHKYNDPEPLNHGQEYFLWLKYQRKFKDTNGEESMVPGEHLAPFKIVQNGNFRNQIEAELNELISQNVNLNNQEIAEERAKYFVDLKLWSDFIQEAFSVKNPSADLIEFKEVILNQDSCTVK
ncbi:MAG: hypothetical protein F6K58_24045 [Symploca sp. SIO2E9]|nr:hypothetical protein [Symploca sp. SIO2E9]